MQLLIEVCDNYKDLLDYDNPNWLEYSVYKGIPLPKHHGDLIDRNELHYHCNYNNGLGCDKICHCDGCVHNVIQERTVNAASTIIPATKEGDGK